MADAREPDEGGSDLFDRWLSHRQESTGEAPRPRTYGVPRTGLAGEESADPGSTPAEDGTRHEAADAAAAAPAVAAADSAAVEPPEDGAASDGVQQQVHADAAPTEPATPQPPAHREPVGLDDFEPVVIASVRRQAEAPVEKRSRLARFRRAGLETEPADVGPADVGPADEGPARDEPVGGDGAIDDRAIDDRAIDPVATPHEATARAAVEPAPPAPEPTMPVEPTPPSTEPHPGHDEPPPPPARPTAYVARTPSPPPPVADVPVADVPAVQAPAADAPVDDDEPATPGGSDPITRTPAPPSADPGRQQDAAAAVFAAFNPGAAPTPVAPPATRGPHSSTAPATTPTPPAAAAARGDAPPVPPTIPEPPRRAPRRPRPSLTSYVRAARTTLDRSVRGTPEERTPTSPTTTPPAATDLPAPDGTGTPAPAAEVTPARSAYDELRAQREAAAPPQPDVLPPSIDFRPRTLARRVTSALLLVGLLATGIAAWRAYDSRVETDIGLAAILALATGVVWAVRAGSVPTRVGLHGGVLEVRSQAGRFVFEVTGAHTRLEVVGSPGRRGSRLLVHRRGLSPFAITPAMVDLRRLVEALRYYRPDL